MTPLRFVTMDIICKYGFTYVSIVQKFSSWRVFVAHAGSFLESCQRGPWLVLYLLLMAYSMYDVGRPGPSWPLPTRLLCICTPTADTDPLTDFQKHHTDT